MVESYYFPIGLPEILLSLVLLAAVVFGIWTLAKMVWTAFSD